ncbi:MAG: AraC family transcriptional regulator [Myxococcales bacterium]
MRDRGISTETFLRDAGIDRDVFEGPANVDMAVTAQAVRSAYRLTEDPAIALRIGMSAPFQSLGVAGQVFLHCPTIRAVIGEVDRYLPLLQPMSRLRMLEEGDRAHLIYEPPFADARAYRFGTELALAFVVRIGRHFTTQRATPIEVRVCHQAPSYAGVYGELFGCPVRFGAARNEIVFNRALLDVPQPFSDEPLWRVLKHRAEEMLVQEQAREHLHERVKQVLHHEVDLSSVHPVGIARRLGMSPRSLRRRLSDEGHSLSALVDEVRREVALTELGNPEMPIKRIADRVGFSEVSAFHRAFKRWTGLTPARYRAQGVSGLARAS